VCINHVMPRVTLTIYMKQELDTISFVLFTMVNSNSQNSN